MRERCPVAYSEFLGWSLFRYDDVLRATADPRSFSNATKRHPIPNGLDPPEHTRYRRALDPHFSPERLRAFEPRYREVAIAPVEPLLDAGDRLTSWAPIGVGAAPGCWRAARAFRARTRSAARSRASRLGLTGALPALKRTISAHKCHLPGTCSAPSGWCRGRPTPAFRACPLAPERTCVGRERASGPHREVVRLASSQARPLMTRWVAMGGTSAAAPRASRVGRGNQGSVAHGSRLRRSPSRRHRSRRECGRLRRRAERDHT